MKHIRILLLIALLGAGAVAIPNLRGTTITVTNTSDNGPGSLRQALADAADGDTINFASSLNGQMIMLTSGELLVNKSIAVLGPGANTLAVDANHASRVFYIASGKDVTIFGLTIRNGTAPPPNFGGGGIYNDHATLTLSSCTVSGNSAPVFGEGGGIVNDHATLTLSNCIVSGNSAPYGGGIFNETAVLTVSTSTFSGNSASQGGGGISSTGNSPSAIATAAINNSTFSGNSASWGGGVNNSFAGTLTVTNSTFSGNSAGSPEPSASNGLGGAIYNEQILTMTNSTLSGNSAINHGGGIYTYDPAANGVILKVGNTIFNAGSSGENLYNDATAPGIVISLGYNLSSDNGGDLLTATGDKINMDPRLGPLQDNGGPTFTHLPASDSPAIDAGDPARGMDQRGIGFQRVVNGIIDAGAVEVQATGSPTPTPTPTPSPSATPTPTPHKKPHR